MTSGLLQNPKPGDAQSLPVYFPTIAEHPQLGFTFAPGRRGRDPQGRFWTRDLDEDIHYLTSIHPSPVLFLLLTPPELKTFRIQDLPAKAQQSGLELRLNPLSPTTADLKKSAIQAMITTGAQLIAKGQTVIFISGDALGRGPLVSACYAIVHKQLPVDEVLTTLRQLRGPSCISPTLESWIRAYQQQPDLQTAGAYTVANTYRTWSKSHLDSDITGADLKPQTTAEDELQTPLPFSRWTTSSPPSEHPEAAWTPAESICVGTVLGAALGDALGAPLTTQDDWSQLVRRYGLDGPSAPTAVNMGSEKPPQARISGHTEMMVGALETLINVRQRRLELSETMDRLSHRLGLWARQTVVHTEHPPSGIDSCRRLAAGETWTEVGSNSTQGAAGLARAISFGLTFPDDLRRVETWGAAQSRITHRAPSSTAAAAALAVGIARLTHGRTWNDTFSEMVAAACRICPETASRMARGLHDAQQGISAASKNRRFGTRSTQDTLIQALIAVCLHPDDLETALRTAVMTTGDAHAVGASVGALMGARLGWGALPMSWLSLLEQKSRLEGLALALAASR
ncbi:MAG: ADP-ribosylglycohydrolase family protein [Myxococcales bacterium]|nr:ADP-ribosylglycohydrolase family protein [Myxococcales bacterium]